MRSQMMLFAIRALGFHGLKAFEIVHAMRSVLCAGRLSVNPLAFAESSCFPLGHSIDAANCGEAP